MTAADAIAASAGQTRIVTLDWTPEIESDLRTASDDSVRNGRVYEFWGTDEDGDKWRVHLRREVQS